MNAKDFLLRYRVADEKIKMLNAEIERIELSAQGGSANGDGQPHGSGKSDKVGRVASKAADMQLSLEAWKIEQERIKMEIIGVLGGVTRRELFEVLQMRYIAPRPADEWFNIAHVLKRSVRQAQRLHGEALLEVQRILNERRDDGEV